MNHHYIPLATATLALTIARPALAASGLGSTLITQIEYVAPAFAVLGISFLVINNLLGEHNFEERYQNINRIVKFLLSASMLGFLILGLYYSLS